MIEAMAIAGAALSETKYIEAAKKASDFLLTQLRREDGRLMHTWRHGEAKLDAYLDDYTCLANALVSLYEATAEARYLEESIALTQVVLEKFHDKKAQGFFFTADDHEQLIVRSKDSMDNAVPSGNAMAATLLVRLAKLTGKASYLDAAEGTFLSNLELMERAPSATSQLMIALSLHLGPTYEMVFAGDSADETSQTILTDLYGRFLPNKVLAFAGTESRPAPASLADLLKGKTMLGNQPTLYVCEGFTCQAPGQGADEIKHLLDDLVPEGKFD